MKASITERQVDRLWTVDDLATFLRLSRKSAYRLVESPDGPPIIRLGARRVRLDPAAVRTWLQERQP